MTIYAKGTSVSVEKSKAEIERTLQRYGATEFVYGTTPDRALVAFNIADRRVKFILPLPRRDSREFTHTPDRGLERPPAGVLKEWEQACREKWRSLALLIKAKLEAVESGITVFDEEFMAQIVLPNGKTVGEFMVPQITESYNSGSMPPLLEM